MHTIYVDGYPYIWDGTPMTVYQFLTNKGIVVPCFCYHEKLDIAGNCRMCLIEIDEVLVVSCSFPMEPLLDIVTVNERIEEARENVLEFLLANHPLDCPVCDQGGECDLQDISKIFGSNFGRFYEEKRAVGNLTCFGPLVKTEMNRCIHCTRCVRLLETIGASSTLGVLGRGASMEIGTFTLPAFISAPLSGNVIDLCPVGALTAMPSAFSARPWESKIIESIDIFDSLMGSVRLDVSNNRVVRCLPATNENLNEDWITNKARFVYPSIKPQHLTSPLFKVNGAWKSISWELAACLLFSKLWVNDNRFFGYFGNFVDLETAALFKEFSYILGNEIPYHEEVRNVRSDHRDLFLLNGSMAQLEDSSMIVLIGCDLQYEAALLHAKYQRVYSETLGDDTPFSVFSIGPGTLSMGSIPVKQLGASLEDLDLFSLFKLNGMQEFVFDPKNLYRGFSGRPPRHCRPRIILGSSALRSEHAALIQNRLWDFCRWWESKLPEDSKTSGLKIYNALLDYPGKISALILGCSVSPDEETGSLRSSKENPAVRYHLMSEYPQWSRTHPDDFIIYQGCVCPEDSDADLFIPVATPLERACSYVNAFGEVRNSTAVLSSLDTTRTDPEVFRFFKDFVFSEIDNIYSRTSYAHFVSSAEFERYFVSQKQLFKTEKMFLFELESKFDKVSTKFPWSGDFAKGLLVHHGIDLKKKTVERSSILGNLDVSREEVLPNVLIGDYREPYYSSDVLTRASLLLARSSALHVPSNWPHPPRKP